MDQDKYDAAVQRGCGDEQGPDFTFEIDGVTHIADIKTEESRRSTSRAIERWTIYVCAGCGLATGRHKDCDAQREAVEVVPAESAQGIALDRETLRAGARDIAYGDYADSAARAMARQMLSDTGGR